MTICPFCSQEKENVVQREMRVPSTKLTAKSQFGMCDDCFAGVEEAFSRQEAEMLPTDKPIEM